MPKAIRSHSRSEPPPDKNRDTQFREIARRIIQHDREARRIGMSVDTAGAVARALKAVMSQ